MARALLIAIGLVNSRFDEVFEDQTIWSVGARKKMIEKRKQKQTKYINALTPLECLIRNVIVSDPMDASGEQ